MNANTRHINRFWYYFSLLTWGVNIAFVIIPFFFDFSAVWIVGVFISVFVQGFVSGAFLDQTAVPKTGAKQKIIDYCLLASKYISAILFAICFLSLFIGGGRPEMIDEAYCIVNHGEIVRHISGKWFLFFVICEMLMFTCGMLHCSTYMALRIRALYVIQNTTAE